MPRLIYRIRKMAVKHYFAYNVKATTLLQASYEGGTRWPRREYGQTTNKNAGNNGHRTSALPNEQPSTSGGSGGRSEGGAPGEEGNSNKRGGDSFRRRPDEPSLRRLSRAPPQFAPPERRPERWGRGLLCLSISGYPFESEVDNPIRGSA